MQNPFVWRILCAIWLKSPLRHYGWAGPPSVKQPCVTLTSSSRLVTRPSRLEGCEIQKSPSDAFYKSYCYVKCRKDNIWGLKFRRRIFRSKIAKIDLFRGYVWGACVTVWLLCHRLLWLDADWLSSVLRHRQHSIGYMEDGFYRSKDPTNSIKVLNEHIVQGLMHSNQNGLLLSILSHVLPVVLISVRPL